MSKSFEFAQQLTLAVLQDNKYFKINPNTIVTDGNHIAMFFETVYKKLREIEDAENQ